jgi:hypothetical protein
VAQILVENARLHLLETLKGNLANLEEEIFISADSLEHAIDELLLLRLFVKLLYRLNLSNNIFLK